MKPTDDPPSDDPTPPPGDRDLLARLERASDTAVSKASRQLGHFSAEDAEAENRRTKSANRRTISQIKRAFFWFLFCALCVMISVLGASYLFLIWMWLCTLLYGTEVHDAAALKSFIDGVLWSLLIIFATLFFEGVFKDKD
jgi:hypothetical protein